MLDATHQSIVVRLVDVSAREFRFDGNGTHVLDRGARLINRLHEQAVLIDSTSIDFCEALPDRLDIADAGEPSLQRCV